MARCKRMTVCDDWPSGTMARMCWFHHGCETGAYCDLGVFGRSNYPEVCPHAKALRTVIKNRGLVLAVREWEPEEGDE